MNLFHAAGILILLLFVTLPVSADISINQVYYAGEKIVISGYTNYNADNSILIEIWPASFGPKGKYEPSMAGGGSSVVPVVKGNISNYIWSETFDSAGWVPDTYMVRAEVIGKGSIETETFELTEERTEQVIPSEPTITPVESVIKSSNNSEEMQNESEMRDSLGSFQTTPVPTQKSPLNISNCFISLLIAIAGIFIVKFRQ